jgi:CubicO group peptidase (beta-lactamase class C family)
VPDAHPARPITVRHLLSHTSSLRNGPSYPVPAGHALREAFEPQGRHFDGGSWFGPAAHAPGEWFAYADVNFCLLAQIAERATGERFDRFMHRTVLGPLGLDAGYNWSGVSAARRAQAAPGLRWRDGGWVEQVDGRVPVWPDVALPQPSDGPPVGEADLQPGTNGFLFSPQGGLRLSLRDMDRLAGCYRDGCRYRGQRLLRSETFELMQSAVWRLDPARPNGDTAEGDGVAGLFGAYGLAVELPGSAASGGDAFFGAGSQDWRGHLGDAYGWLTGLFWNRRDGRTLVYAINGVRETGRAPARRSALTLPEERLIEIVRASRG